MPPHGQAAWDGTGGLGARGEVTSIVTGERLRPVSVGDVVWTKADDGARGGMVVDIEVDGFGERQLLIVTHNENLSRPQAWTIRLAESDLDPTKTIPDTMAKRHGYAKFLYKAVGDGRYISASDLRLAGIAAGLVADCVKG
jgi:hypothetical protein